MTIPRFRHLQDSWEVHPPVGVLMEAMVHFKPKAGSRAKVGDSSAQVMGAKEQFEMLMAAGGSINAAALAG